jgi:hypothetical protein
MLGKLGRGGVTRGGCTQGELIKVRASQLVRMIMYKVYFYYSTSHDASSHCTAHKCSFSLHVFLAIDVAALRPSNEARTTGQHLSPKASYSNQSSLKLFALLTDLYNRGGYSHTFGALDPVQVIQMAPHLTSIYVSGWQCSSTASSTNDPGPDFAGM